MYIYKVKDTGNFYLKYEKAVAALRAYIGTVNVKRWNIVYDNLNGYYNEAGKVTGHVDNIPQIVMINDDDEKAVFIIQRVEVRE